MAIERKVRARFEGNDKLTKRFGIMERAASRFGRKTEGAFKRINKQGNKFRGITSGFLKAQVIGGGFRMLSQGIGSVVSQFIAFDKAALGATVRFTDIGPKAANFNEKLKEIEKSARDAGATTQFTAAQAAEGLNFMAKAGFTSTEAMMGLESMINLSIATGEDFNSVADQSSDLLGSFGLSADNAAEKIANLNRLNDVLVKTSNSANVTMETMFETMKIAAPIGASLGIELEEIAAVTGVLGAAGIKGSMAATALKNSFLNLTTGKKPVMDMLGAIGAKIKTDTKGNFLFTDTLDDITKKTKDMSKIQRAKVFDQIFGKLAIAGAINLGNAVSTIKDLEKALKSAGGESKLTAEIMGRSIEAKLLVLSSTATEFGFKILEAFRGDAKGGIDSMTQSIRDMDVKPFIDSLKVMLTVASSLGSAFWYIGDRIGFVAAKMAELNESSGTFRALLSVLKQATGFNIVETAGQLIGGGSEQSAPNAAEAPARAQAQSVNVGGTINVNGPAGTTAESDGPVGFNLNDLGLNGA